LIRRKKTEVERSILILSEVYNLGLTQDHPDIVEFPESDSSLDGNGQLLFVDLRTCSSPWFLPHAIFQANDQKL